MAAAKALLMGFIILVATITIGQKEAVLPVVSSATTAPIIAANHSSPVPRSNYLETGRQVTAILDRFMSMGYDKRVRPNYGGPPVEVNVTMRIISISSVSEVQMDFTADFYFRQTWRDPRLSFKKVADIQKLYVGAEVSKKIWLPDTFFGNEKMAYFHEATTPNVFLRIDHSGEVYRSIRLTVTSSCPMNLQYFPMDRQRCTIEAESYGYNVKDIIYSWARENTAVERDEEISLPQFDIVRTVQKYRLEELSSGTYSRLIAEIHFARRMGYYLIQIYIPSSLTVVISWVSFWLHRNASPARVQLGITTVLTMTTLMSSTNSALPKVSYVKSIDIFLGTCFVMVFASLLEYSALCYLGKRIAMRKARSQQVRSRAQARLFAQLQAKGAAASGTIEAGDGSNAGPPLASIPLSAVAEPSAAHGGLSSSLISQQQRHAAALMAGTTESGPFTDSGQPVCDLLGEPVPVQAQPPLYQTARYAPSKRSHQRTDAGNGRPPLAPQRKCHQCLRCSLPRISQPSAATEDGHCLGGGAKRQLAKFHLEPLCPTAAAERHSRVLADSCGCNNRHSQSANVNWVQLADQVPNQGSPLTGAPEPSLFGKAATAAAATLVNIHRRNRGLPPSSNPNFAPAATATAGASGIGANPGVWQGGGPARPAGPHTAASALAGFLGGPESRSLDAILGIRPSDIDKYSRVVFPVCFVCFQLMYWIVYLHISAFLEGEQLQQQPLQPSSLPANSSHSSGTLMSVVAGGSLIGPQNTSAVTVGGTLLALG